MEYDRILYTLHTCGLFTTIWPLDSKASKFKTFSYNVLWFIYTLNIICLNYLIIKSMLFTNQEDFIKSIGTLVNLIFSMEILFNLLYSKMQKKRLQKLLFEIYQPDKIWMSYEKSVWLKFMHHTCTKYFPLALIHIGAAGLTSLSPMLTDKYLPLTVVYSFSISKPWIYYAVYIYQVLTITHSSVTIILDLMIISTMWHATFKFYLLGIQMRSVFTINKLRASIMMYQNTLNYVRELDCFACYILLKLTIVASIYVIACGLLILNKASIVELSLSLLITSISIWRLFVCCWSAEAITNMSYNISWQIYDSPWTNASQNVRRTIFMVIQRCQKPVVVSGTHFIPIVSMRFCGTVVCATFSYFMALRTILDVY